MFIAEVVDTKKAFKPDQKDSEGNSLSLGSVLVRILPGTGYAGPTNLEYAKPATYNKRIPLIGEHILISPAPVNSNYNQGIKGSGLVYYTPINVLDDLTLNMIPKSWKREGGTNVGDSSKGPNDQEKPGYTFPDNPKKVLGLQPFEGDDLIEGRLGQSLRFTSTVQGDLSIYQNKPWWTGGAKGDPMAIMRVSKAVETGSRNKRGADGRWKSTSTYTLEDPEKDEASIYLTSTQSLAKIKAGFTKNRQAAGIGSYGGGQVLIHADRVVLNAKKDQAIMVAKEQSVVTAKKVLFQSDQHKVDLDDLMEYIKTLTGLCNDLATAKAQYATAAGPTAISTNAPQFTKHFTATFTQKFKTP